MPDKSYLERIYNRVKAKAKKPIKLFARIGCNFKDSLDGL